jgi:hypothetical protein
MTASRTDPTTRPILEHILAPSGDFASFRRVVSAKRVTRSLQRSATELSTMSERSTLRSEQDATIANVRTV